LNGLNPPENGGEFTFRGRQRYRKGTTEIWTRDNTQTDIEMTDRGLKRGEWRDRCRNRRICRDIEKEQQKRYRNLTMDRNIETEQQQKI
jgi:hypothetical protein